MRLLVAGACGFVGSTIIRALIEYSPALQVWGLDNFCREGSRGNAGTLARLGVHVVEGDTRNPSDLARIPDVDWVIDCAAEPSVVAGVTGGVSSFDVMDNNFIGTLRLLEFCRSTGAGLVFMSTSRVYAIRPLAALEVTTVDGAYRPVLDGSVAGLSEHGIREEFSTDPPVSLYGISKRASELVALEYADAFSIPVWINRCGVLAGRGQFGKADQGIVSYWIRSWRDGASLKYIGFDGLGYQVRDCLHPRDLAPLLLRQCRGGTPSRTNDGSVDTRISNFSGGLSNSFSLSQLSEWCNERFGQRVVGKEPCARPYDLPWVVLDSARAVRLWEWAPTTTLQEIFEEVASHLPPQ